MTSTEVASEVKSEGKRGAPKGPRGPREWKDEPTLRERVMNKSLQEAVKEATGKDIDVETIRAIRFTLPRWAKSEEFQEKKNNLQTEIKRAKAEAKKERALKLLARAEAELAGEEFDDDEDDDNDSDSPEDDDDEDDDDFEDDDDDDDDDDEVDFKNADSNVRSF